MTGRGPTGVAVGRGAGLAVLCGSMLLIGLDNSILNVALAPLQRATGVQAPELRWILDAYPVALAGLVLAGGRWADRFGRRRALMLGLAICASASGLGAVSDTGTGLITARAAMGVGAALVMPATLALTSDLFEGHPKRREAVAAWTVSAGVGMIVGPVVGGWLLSHFTWQCGFWVNIPVCVLGLLAAPSVLPRGHGRADQPLDLPGTAVSTLALTALVATVISAPAHGWTSPRTAAGLALGVTTLTWYVRRERRRTPPALPLDLLARPSYRGALAVIMLLFVTLAGMGLLMTVHLQGVLGFTPAEAGLALTPCALAVAAGSACGLLVPARTGPATPVAVGAGIAAVGHLTVLWCTPQSGYPPVCAALVLVGLGLGLAVMPCTEAVMYAAPPERVGTAAAMNDTTRATGSAFGIAVFSSLCDTVYADRLTARGTGLPAQALEAARDHLLTALALADALPAPRAAALTAAAREAFVTGTHTAACVAAAICLTALATACLQLRRPAPPRVPAPDPRVTV